MPKPKTAAPSNEIPPAAIPVTRRTRKIKRDLPPGFEEVFSSGRHEGKPRCRCGRKEDDPTRGVNPQTGKPYRRTGTKQCSNVAAPGYQVCMRHGAGSGKRVDSGERKDPRAAAVANQWPGFDRLGPDVRQAADTYAAAGEEALGSLRNLMILAHVQLETIMLTGREALAVYELNKGKVGDDPGGAIAALDKVGAINARASAQIETILKVLDQTNKSTRAAEGIITPAQFLYTLTQITERIRILADDASVRREDMADRLIEWLHAFVSGQSAAAGPA